MITVNQTKLPNKFSYIRLNTCRQVADAIKTMKIRGAPLIGVAASYGLALAAQKTAAKNSKALLRELNSSARMLVATRPTGVNLRWAVERVMSKIKETATVDENKRMVLEEAKRIAEEDYEANLKIGEYGARLIEDNDVVLTHCNAGSLATAGYGTALGVIKTARRQGKEVKVIATETRPLLQGARLTAFELMREKIPVTLVTDNMVGYLMWKRLVNKVFVGADRIVRDAVLNKVGTYTIAVLAKENSIPFYVAAPLSTFDLSKTSKDIALEERNGEEVTHFGGKRVAPKGVKALNIAFDVTPEKYVKAVITEKGVFYPPIAGLLRT